MRNIIKTWPFLFLFMYAIDLHTQTTAIPDANFEKALIDLGIDKDGLINGSVATENISGITSLDVSGKNIVSLTGIEGFVSLTALYCQENLLESLKLSDNTKLSILNCSKNNLNALGVAALADLKILNCGLNRISDLNVSNNTKLEEFYCDHNLIANLNLKNNTELLVFNCAGNRLSNLTLTYNWKLKYLDFSSNLFELLDLMYQVKLEYLDCSKNPLTSVFLNNMVELRKAIMVDNDLLTRVNFGHNYRLEEIICRDNDMLATIDLVGATALKYMNCSNNLLAALDVSKNLLLENIYCQHNAITDLDLSLNTRLAFLKCNDNKLKTLNLKNGNNALMTGGMTWYDGQTIFSEGMNALNNPSLLCIQVDNETSANSGLVPYDSWVKDAWAAYSNDCSIFLGVEEVNLNNLISVFPNPATGMITVDTGSVVAENLMIYTVLGNVVREVNPMTHHIDISDLSSGLYILRLTFDRKVVVKKLIKI